MLRSASHEAKVSLHLKVQPGGYHLDSFKWLVRHSCLISLLSHTKRTSNGVRRFPHVGRNLLPPLDIQILDISSVKCLILLFEVKSILPDGYPCWQDGCFQIWQNPRWLPPWPKAMWSCPRARI